MRTKSGHLIFQSIKEGLNNGFTDCRKHVSNYELNLNKEIISNNTQWIYDNLEEFPDSLDDNQKEIKIKNIIYSLNKKGIIKKSGKAAKYAKWILPENQ